MASFWQQFKTLIWRNLLLKWRKREGILLELLLPILIMAYTASRHYWRNVKPSLVFPELALNNSGFGHPFQSDKVILGSPYTTQADEWMKSVVSQLPGPPSYRLFNTSGDAEAYYEDASETARKNIAAGVIFNYNGNANSYAIRIASKEIPSTKLLHLPNKDTMCRDEHGFDSKSCKTNAYLTTGFVLLQRALENVIMKSLGVTSPDPTKREIKVRMMNRLSHDSKAVLTGPMLPISFAMVFIFMIHQLSVTIVAEKSKQIKEGMMMMGLRGSVYWMSWVIAYSVGMLIVLITSMILIVVVEMFTQSNMIILFLAFLSYGLSAITMGLLTTTFIQKPETANLVMIGGLVMCYAYFVIIKTKPTGSYNSTIDPRLQYVLCLMSPFAFAAFIDQAIYLDTRMEGFDFDSSMTYGKYPLYAPLVMLVVDTVLYAMLALYFDKVIPGKYGLNLHPLFFLQSSYWFPGKNRVKRRSLKNEAPASVAVEIESVGTNMIDKLAVRIDSLTKTIKVRQKVTNVVDGFSLDIYMSEITCLLGHNGAGKTTLMNMLTGVIPPTSGTATVLGYDITNAHELEQLRRVCGICPQVNILLDELSCREHLCIFANIKGVPKSQVDRAIESYLQDVGLANQGDTLSTKLSGGQKRKLCVAMALIGDPKLIILDEPTAGMDPFSRRHLWSMLKKKKEGRVMLLTTHFMDEADILSDRKAFISKGKLQCCGTSLYLKNKFGVGYHLIMVSTPDCDVPNVTTCLQKIIPNIKLERSHGREIGYTIPWKDVDKFAELMVMLDDSAQDIGIMSYGVSMTSLEEVFLKLEDVAAETEELQSKTPALDNKDAGATLSTGDNGHLGTSLLTGKNLYKQKFRGLMHIQLLKFCQIKLALLAQFALAIGIVVGPLVLIKKMISTPTNKQGAPVSFDPHWYAGSGSVHTSSIPMLIYDNTNEANARYVISKFRSQVLVDEYKGIASNLAGVAPHAMGMQLESLTGKVLTNFVAVYNYSSVHAIPVLINMATQNILASAGINKTVKAYSIPWPDTNQIKATPNVVLMVTFLIGYGFVIPLSRITALIVGDKEKKIRGQLRISGVGFDLYWGSVYLSNLLAYLIPCLSIFIGLLAVNFDALNSSGAISAMAVLFITSIPLNTMLTILCSFFFDKAEDCSKYLEIILPVLALVPYGAMKFVYSESTDFGIFLHYVLCFTIPPYNILGGLDFILQVYILANSNMRSVTFGEYFEPSSHILVCFIAPFVDFLWVYWVVRILDTRSVGGNLWEAFTCIDSRVESCTNNADVIKDEDEDVASERATIEKLKSTDAADTQPVAYTSQLRKTFDKKVVVRNLSFGVKKGEVLGLLGPNGAGKSTTMNMIIAETAPTCGKVVVAGNNVRRNTLTLLETLGYCPQHDPLWDLLTLEDHIRFFATIKGFPRGEIDGVINFYIKSLKLEEHRFKATTNLSGGTKRKLCYILSILGSPRFVLMDEPSTGMDPKSKRFLWDTISASFENSERGAILTTHYMEEADALCDRVGILINGALKCLGSTQHLKSRFGSGYILEIKLRFKSGDDIKQLMDKLEKHLFTLFPDMETVERFQERAQYAVPKENVVSLGKIFANLEQCKLIHNVEGYSFSQSSLEQVFLQFSKQQQDEDV